MQQGDGPMCEEVAPLLNDQGLQNEGGRLDPALAAPQTARWRRALADAAGGDPGGALDTPMRRLTLLKVFGSTTHLASWCFKTPMAVAAALTDDPSKVIAEAARDLTALEGGIGGAEALHAALEPIKMRCDVAIGVAEISGHWTASQAASARAEFAERLVETALRWLLRGAVNRGELSIDLDEGPASGVFALASGDFAQEELAPFGPLNIAILYDGTVFDGQAARMAERAFVRLGAEFREVFAGKSGEQALFALKTPLGTAVKGAGLVETIARVENDLELGQDKALPAFLRGARIVAGDRMAGGAFLESVEAAIWAEGMGEEAAEQALNAHTGPCGPMRALGDVLRLKLGRVRPMFRTAPARTLFAKAASTGLIDEAAAGRLVAGEDFAQGVVARAQFIGGIEALNVQGPKEQAALASLYGFEDYADIERVLAGAHADAHNALAMISDNRKSAFMRYTPNACAEKDAENLEDLGFGDGVKLSDLVDAWADQVSGAEKTRFSQIAPGLLTAFGQTQHPDEAVELFDGVMDVTGGDYAVLGPVTDEDGEARQAMVDALGCFGAAVAPLTRDQNGLEIMLGRQGELTPKDGEEWVARNVPPADGAAVDQIAAWRRENLAEIAYRAAAGDMSFGAADSAFEEVHKATLRQVMRAQDLGGAPKGLALHIFDYALCGLPGKPSAIGFIATDSDKSAGEKEACESFAGAYVNALDALDDGFFALQTELTHRPSGSAGALAPNVEAVKAYIQSEAIASDQILLARARVIDGGDKAQHKAGAALRAAVSNPKRADILFRDLDRARAQKMRRDKPASEWDMMRIDGGLADVELIVSALIYRNAAALPVIQQTNAPEALGALARAGCIPHETAAILQEAWAFWTRLAVVKTLAQWSDPQQQPVRGRLAALLASAAEVDNFSQVRPLMRGYAQEVNRLYAQLVLGRPAMALAANA